MVAQAQTRRRIKEIGRQMLLDEGYTAASIASIAEEAGFTTGAFYSNFTSKAQLTLEVLADLQQECQDELADILAAPADADVIDRLHTWCNRLLDSGWPRLELEFALSIRGDDELVATEGDRNREAVNGLAPLIAERLPVPSTGPFAAENVAEMILNMAFGIAVRNVIDPRVTADGIFESIRTVMSAQVADG
ncbi:putative TetR family transcriptional regulator [Gordonia araii NBRC 100433]|uniref:Putative TetR family transcriptional regulator n=1 Tax=Gordonia araii NBRC 100433 TaxID=1073574 RepID=G7H059_9ACTN|nr:putative TetR family transcriptional regulator [Gordonia araii NBRC 100433]